MTSNLRVTDTYIFFCFVLVKMNLVPNVVHINSTTLIWFYQYISVVRNHVKLIHIVTSRRGFSMGTVLCGGY